MALETPIVPHENSGLEKRPTMVTGWWFFASPLKNVKVSWDYEIPNI